MRFIMSALLKATVTHFWSCWNPKLSLLFFMVTKYLTTYKPLHSSFLTNLQKKSIFKIDSDTVFKSSALQLCNTAPLFIDT